MTPQYVEANQCEDCGSPISHTYGRLTTVCHQCYGKRITISVRDDELQCCSCHRWLRDTRFYNATRSRYEYRRFRSSECKECSNARRRGRKTMLSDHPRYTPPTTDKAT